MKVGFHEIYLKINWVFTVLLLKERIIFFLENSVIYLYYGGILIGLGSEREQMHLLELIFGLGGSKL